MHHDMNHMMMASASPAPHSPLQWLLAWLSGNGYAPHSGCFLGDTMWVRAYVAGNWVIALAYALVALLIAQRMQRASHIPKTLMGNALLGIFITCSVGHFLAGLTTVLWPGYRLETLWHWVTTIPAWLFLAHHKKFSLIVEGPHMIAESREELSRKNGELNALYEQVKQVDRLKSEFFANVSHELRTPLALILGPLNSVMAGDNLTPAQRNELEVAARNARTVLKHVNDLLDIARMEADKMSMRYVQCDLAQSTRLAASHFESVVGERGLTLTLDTPPTLDAQIDEDKIQRVLLNLLSNAVKFTPQGGAIICRLSQEDGEAILQVQDNGPGIPAEMREAVFERFRQVDSAATRRHEGTGLGLAIVKEFIRLHGGSITAREAPGGGALFYVTLPLNAPAGVPVGPAPQEASTVPTPRDRDANETAQGFVDEGVGGDRFARPTDADAANGASVSGTANTGAAASVSMSPHRSADSMSANDAQAVMIQTLEELRLREQAEAETQDTGQPLVLIVEDNLEMSQFIARTLAPQYRTAIARDGEQGIRRAMDLSPDLILSDVMMPNKSGDEMVREMRGIAALDAVPIVLLTAKDDDALRIQMLRDGAQDYLSKPFTSEELHARISSLIAAKRARQLLQTELTTQQQSLEALAAEAISRKRVLQIALTEARAARESAEQAREQAVTLQHEVDERNVLLSKAILQAHHRIKNNLQIVSALMEMQVDDRETGLPLPIARAYLRQVKCIALVHNLLSPASDYTVVDAAQVLQSVVALALQAQSGSASGRSIVLQADALPVHVKIATSLALIINELLADDVVGQRQLQEGVSSNAIIISLRREGGDVFLAAQSARWNFAPDFDVSLSGTLGLELVATLVASDLQGRVSFHNAAPDSVNADRTAPAAQFGERLVGRIAIVFPERPDAA